MSEKGFLARKDIHGNTQTLKDHLENAAKIAQSFETEYSSIAYFSSLLHDLGKATQQFQEYLLSDNGARGSVIHAWQGAFKVNDIPVHSPEEKIVQELLELVISKHHGDLPDCITQDGMYTFFDRFSQENKDKSEYAYHEVNENLNLLNLPISDCFRDAARELQCFEEAVKGKVKKRSSLDFFIGLFAKYIFSRLIDSDRLDAADFEEHTRYDRRETNWSVLIQHFENNMLKFDSSSHLDQMRQRISAGCRDASDRNTGIYKLAVPTGGGKTLASLNFALHHAQKYKKKRIIYVIPYLSITSQTVQTFRSVLDISENSDLLLEHYSSVISDYTENLSLSSSEEQIEREDETLRERKRATERWDNPIIVTTMVQFLETIMSSHGTKLRKFHNMADSVIVFDEIQSLPTNVINPFNEIISFLSLILNSTILLCSATQPLLEKTSRENLLLPSNPKLITLNKDELKSLKRTQVIASLDEKNSKEMAEIAFQKAIENGNCLVIVNLKSEAREIFQELQTINDKKGRIFQLVHLSTSMCGKHRADELALVKELLETNDSQPLICVSTQLIEAGVDLSFACVIRAMAGLDSILQAAGRCNRNGESIQPKKVYVFPMKDEKGLDNLKDIRVGKEITDQLVREYPNTDLLSDSLLVEFYNRFFERLQGEQHAMDYPMKSAKDGNAYDLLSTNRLAKENYEKNRHEKKYAHCFAQAFRTVSDNFRLIPSSGHNVVVKYGSSEDLISQLNKEHIPQQKYKLLRRLQDYSVSLFDYEYERLLDQKAITIVNDTFGVEMLEGDYYNSQYGVVLEAKQSLLFI